MSDDKKKQVFTIEMESAKPTFKGLIKDSVTGETLFFNNAGQQINFITKHIVESGASKNQ